MRVPSPVNAAVAEFGFADAKDMQALLRAVTFRLYPSIESKDTRDRLRRATEAIGNATATLDAAAKSWGTLKDSGVTAGADLVREPIRYHHAAVAAYFTAIALATEEADLRARAEDFCEREQEYTKAWIDALELASQSARPPHR